MAIESEAALTCHNAFGAHGGRRHIPLRRKIMKLLTALALALLSASAMQAETPLFGFQGTVTKPSGDVGDSEWMDGKVGLGIGVHAMFPMVGGAAIVPRIDYTVYKNDWTRDANINEEAKIKILSGGADFQYYFSGFANQGFFVLAGLGYASGHFDSSYSYNGLNLSVSATKGAVYLQGGLGVQFTPYMGVQVSYQSLKFTDVETTYLGFTTRQDISSPSVQASFVMHF